MRLSTVLYGLMQIAILGAVAWLAVRQAATGGPPINWMGVWLIGIGLAAVATAIVYWVIEGVKRLLGKPRSLPVIPPRGAFDNLRRGAQARQIDGD